MIKLINKLDNENSLFRLIESKREEIEAMKIDNNLTNIYVRGGMCGGMTFENNRQKREHLQIEENIKIIFK